MRPMTPCLAVMATLAMASCSQPPITVSTAAPGDMSSVRTYGWYPGEGDIVGLYGSRGDLAKKTMRESIDKAMRAKGFRPATGGDADVLVRYQLGVKSRREVNSLRTEQRNGVTFAVPDDVTIYRAGTILIYLVDPTINDVVWVGTASAEAKAADSDSQARSRLERGVQAVFKAMKGRKPP